MCSWAPLPLVPPPPGHPLQVRYRLRFAAQSLCSATLSVLLPMLLGISPACVCAACMSSALMLQLGNSKMHTSCAKRLLILSAYQLVIGIYGMHSITAPKLKINQNYSMSDCNHKCSMQDCNLFAGAGWVAPEVGSTVAWQDAGDGRAPLVASVLEQFGRMTALAKETTTNLLTSTAYWGAQPGQHPPGG